MMYCSAPRAEHPISTTRASSPLRARSGCKMRQDRAQSPCPRDSAALSCDWIDYGAGRLATRHITLGRRLTCHQLDPANKGRFEQQLHRSAQTLLSPPPPARQRLAVPSGGNLCQRRASRGAPPVRTTPPRPAPRATCRHALLGCLRSRRESFCEVQPLLHPFPSHSLCQKCPLFEVKLKSNHRSKY